MNKKLIILFAAQKNKMMQYGNLHNHPKFPKTVEEYNNKIKK